MNLGHMNFFNVEQCGLYKAGLKKSNGYELEETFDLLKNWVQDRPLATTLPWDKEKNKAKFYCKEIYKDKSTKDFFIVLWKSDTDSAGTLWGAPEDNENGNGNVIKYTNNYKGKKVIWGRPSYYWVIPEFNIVVSIKFDHSVSDSQLFEDYIKACINNRVKHNNRVVKHTAAGYARISCENDEGINYSYRFSKKLKSINTSSSEIINLQKRITHIVRRETIIVHSDDERAEWVKIFDKIPLVSAKPKSKKRRIEVKAEAKPTVEEIKKVIEDNAIEGRKESDWHNVGFSTENGTVWVDRYRLRDTLYISGNSNKILSSENLFNEISKKRNDFLIPLKNAAKHELMEA